MDRPPWPEAGLDGGQLLAGGHPQVHRVVVPAAAAPCAEQARGGGGGVAFVPLLHTAPWSGGTITARLRRRGSRICRLSVQSRILVLQLILVLYLVLMARAAIGPLLQVPGIEEHGHVHLAAHTH